jgi:hypothetical protein
MDNCPACFRIPTRRLHFKALLAEQEREHPRLFASLLAAMRPLMADNQANDGDSDPHIHDNMSNLVQPNPHKSGSAEHNA